nr:hypothetical protein [Nitrosomonas aestuarii]
MSNHYHLLIETPDGNLSKGMRQLNGVFTQASNRRHDPYFFVVFACIKCLDKD